MLGNSTAHTDTHTAFLSSPSPVTPSLPLPTPGPSPDALFPGTAEGAAPGPGHVVAAQLLCPVVPGQPVKALN